MYTASLCPLIASTSSNRRSSDPSFSFNHPKSPRPSHRGSPRSNCWTTRSLSPSRAMSSAPMLSGSGVPPTSTSISGDDIRGGELGCCGGAGAAEGSTAGAGVVVVDDDDGVPVRVSDRCWAELTGGTKATGGTAAGVTTALWGCGCC